jgi:sarcosine oxidase subunit beta
MAATLAKGEPDEIAGPFSLGRFREGRMIDESVAAAVAH